MKKGKLFTKMEAMFPELKDLSSNRFSGLTRNELLKVAKSLRAHSKNSNYWKNYPQWKSPEIATACFKYMSKL